MTLLQLNNLKKYYKDVKAVDGITFDVKKGEILGLLGPNGAGKSTTISMIATLMTPDSGEILYKDTNIVKDSKLIRKELGYVPQDIALYGALNAKENLEFFGKAYGIKGKVLKDKIAEISAIIGLEDKLKVKVSTYSGGMKRRLNIGVALLHNPELIIMDEPTVGIDPQSRKHILDTVLDLNKKGMTVIYTSHYMEEVAYLCDRICIVDQGHVIASGTQRELVEAHDSNKQFRFKVNLIDENIEAALLKMEMVHDVLVVENELTVTVAKNDDHVLMNMIQAMSQKDMHVQSVEMIEANLETVFLTLTGRALRD